MQLSIVMPVFNERNNIKGVLNELNKVIQDNNISSEIIIVDDGSTDGTKEHLEDLKKQYSIKVELLPHTGKSNAIVHGVSKAKGKNVLMFDGDGQFDPKYIPRFLSYLESEEYSIVIGSKYLNNSWKDNSINRYIIGRGYNIIVNSLFSTNYTDIQGGYKMFRTDTLKSLIENKSYKDFALDTLILLIAAKRGIAIKEVPIVIRNRISGKSSVKILRTILALSLQLIQLFFKVKLVK